MLKKISASVLFDSNYIEPALLTAYEIIKGNFSISDLILIFLDNSQEVDAEASIIINNFTEKFKDYFSISAIKVENTIPNFSKYHFTNSIIYKPLIPDLIKNKDFIINIDAGIIPGANFNKFLDQSIEQSLENKSNWIISAFCELSAGLLPNGLDKFDANILYPNGQVLLFNCDNFRSTSFLARYLEKYNLLSEYLVYAEQELMCITLNEEELLELPLNGERFNYELNIHSLSDVSLIYNYKNIDESCTYSKIIGTLKPWKYWVLDPNKKHWIEKIKNMENEFPISSYELISKNRHEITHQAFQKAFLESHHKNI